MVHIFLADQLCNFKSGMLDRIEVNFGYGKPQMTTRGFVSCWKADGFAHFRFGLEAQQAER